MHAIIYDRASTEGQKDNFSRVNAREVGIRIAEQNGYTWEYVKEIGSGTTLSGRPKMLAILDRIAAGEVQRVIVQDLDRLARPIERAVYETIRNIFIDYDIIVHTQGGTYDFADDDSDFVADINMAVSKKEALRIRKRMRRAKSAKAEAGGWLGGQPPTGYKIIYRDNEPGKKPASDLAINEGERDLINFIFDTLDRTNGNSNQTARIVNKEKFVTQRGGRFTPFMVRKIARRQLSMGIVTSSYTDHVTYRPDLQIISVDKFQRVQSLLDKRKAGERGARGHYAFSGFVICGNCGGPVVAAKGADLRYFCANRRNGTDVCKHGKAYSHAKILPAVIMVIEDIIARLGGLDYALNNAAEAYGKTVSEEALEAAISGDLQVTAHEKTRIIDAIAGGILTPDEARRKLDELRESETRLKIELAGISEKATIREDFLNAIEVLKSTDIKGRLTCISEEQPAIFRRLLGLIFKPNTLRVWIAGPREPAEIEGYELTGSLATLLIAAVSFDTTAKAPL
jgi:DNA invertase Pin-like site-specific DNA recombinase